MVKPKIGTPFVCAEKHSARVGTLREVQGRWHPALVSRHGPLVTAVAMRVYDSNAVRRSDEEVNPDPIGARPTFFSGSAAEGACPLNPPTPERSVGAGVWGNKLLVVKKGFNKYYFKVCTRPGGPGG